MSHIEGARPRERGQAGECGGWLRVPSVNGTVPRCETRLTKIKYWPVTLIGMQRQAPFYNPRDSDLFPLASQFMIHTQNTAAVPLWHKLLKYYRSCLSVEGAGDISLFSSKEGADFIQVPAMEKEWISSGVQALELGRFGPKIQTFLNASPNNAESFSYFYGFPCFIKRNSSQGAGNLILPIFVFGVDLIKSKDGESFTLQAGRPRINSSFLTDKNLLTSVEERKQLAETMLQIWDETKDQEQNLNAVIEMFAELLPEEAMFSPSILRGKTFELDSRVGILPIGVIFKAANSKYTGGLEQELKELQEDSTPNDLWRVLIDRNSQVKENDGDNFLEITKLNDEQRNAVKSAFSNPITVIAGPPGTGKSQVVLNVIANALMHGQSVLFASKNHKAVDVVVERLSRLQTEKIILKFGQNERELDFAEGLLAAVERASVYDKETLDREVSECKKEFDELNSDKKGTNQTLQRILKRRNDVSRIDMKLGELAAEMPAVISQKLNPYRRVEVGASFHSLLGRLSALIKEIDTKTGFVSFILAIFGYTLEKRAKQCALNLADAASGEVLEAESFPAQNYREILDVCRLYKKWIQNQEELLKNIKDNESETRPDVLRERIARLEDRMVGVSLKYVNVLMRQRLSSLDMQERQDIADYVNILRRLDGGIAAGRPSQQLQRERKRKFKSVIKTLPAIAVTNLSVRRVLPLSKDIVDLVIIDEASQCDIASSLPLMYRAKRAVIVGDSKQLTNISLLNRLDDQQLQIEAGLNEGDDQRFVYSTGSLFELARTVIGTGARFIHLLEHYRSRAEIIGYSNQAFYGDDLSVWTDYRELCGSGSDSAVVWHQVAGEVKRPSSGSAYNLKEAEAVVALIEKLAAHLISLNSCPTLGVVTPFREQANKIRILAERKINASLLARLNFTSETAHRYQGDERDIMIFSPVVSSQMNRGTLGFLSNTSNLFNVAITRAKAELHVVGDKMACAQSGVSHLAGFVQYIESLKAEEYLGKAFESPWEKVLHDALAADGVKTVSQYPFHQYRLDLAIPDSKVPIDIEIDGELWHRDIDGKRMRADLKRDYHLSSHGWQVKRFWVYQIKNDLERCVREVKELMK